MLQVIQNPVDYHPKTTKENVIMNETNLQFNNQIYIITLYGFYHFFFEE